MKYRKYEIWHDESKEGSYHHGILMIPVDKKEGLIDLLKKVRDEYKFSYSQPIKFAGSLKKSKTRRCVSNHLSVFSHIIQTQKIKGDNLVTKLYNPTEKYKYDREYSHFLEINGLFDCRFGLLKIADNFETLNSDTYARKVETTFSFILKGCCHGMFDKDNPIEIIKFYFDGDRHHGGKIDLSKIITGNLRDYIKINNEVFIDSRHRKERDEETGMIIDFIDNIVGAWRYKLNDGIDENNILYPISEIHGRLIKNLIFSNKNSRWYKSISLSELKMDGDDFYFPNIFQDHRQSQLF